MTTNLKAVQNDSSAMRLRIAGLVIACSTPITGILSYATVATLAGESSLEGAGGLTALGWSAITAPIVLGLAAVALSFTDIQAPNRRTVGVAAGLLSMAFLGLGIWSIFTTESGDASIGGGLLVLAAIPLVLAAGHLAKPEGEGSTWTVIWGFSLMLVAASVFFAVARLSGSALAGLIASIVVSGLAYESSIAVLRGRN